MPAPDFSGLLRQVMGLDAESIGVSAVASAVKARLAARGISDPQAYWELVCASSTELQALIETVVVPETWFFRDPEAFTTLTRHAANEWLPANPDGTLRLLSLPCSSGEEPYSMAMALLDAGFPAQRWRIDAVDISARALAHAQHGVFGNNSFRGTSLAFRARHFVAASDGYRVNDAVREPVCFQQGNLFSDEFLPGVAPYDAIFCRNLLIYFNSGTQDLALKALLPLLKPDGILFVGPSEGALPLRHGFDSTRLPLSFAFRRCGVASRPSRQVRAESPSSVPRLRCAMQPTLAATVPRASKPSIVPAESLSAGAALEEASVLADQGHLSAAARICVESVRLYGPSARAFHLMGLIASADGDLEAAGHYLRKALYLDQGHYDTLVHLSLLLEKAGDVAEAKLLRNRIRRLQAAGGAT